MATDDADAATLRERVRELEQTVAQQQDTIEQLMPSRRAILAGGAGLVGGAALTGQASAQSAAGQVGTSSEPVDVEAATVNADSVNTERIGSERHFAGAYDGDDIDTRLDNAIAAADLYDTIYLENGGYSSRNLNKRLVLVGTGGIQNSGSSNSGGEWVFDDRILLTRFTASSDITINSKRCQLEQIGGGGGTVTINANGVGVFNSRGIDVSFASGTANGAANGLYDGSSVSDPDGNNEIGTVI